MIRQRQVTILLGAGAVVCALLLFMILKDHVVDRWLIAQLYSDNDHVRWEAIVALGERHSTYAIPHLLRVVKANCLKDKGEGHSYEWWWAAESCLRIGPECAATLFSEAISDETGTIWKMLQSQLVAIRVDTPNIRAAAPSVVCGLQSTDKGVRRRSAEIASVLYMEKEELLSIDVGLRSALQDNDEEIRTIVEDLVNRLERE